MTLKPQVFPREDVDKAGMLEKQNRSTRAALQAASFVEGLSVFENRQLSYSSAGIYTLAEGVLTAKTSQYIQLFGAIAWTSDTATAALNIGIYIDGNQQPLMTVAAEVKSATAASEVRTVALNALLQAPRAQAKFALKANVVFGGAGAFSVTSLGYYRFSGGPT